MEYSIGKIIKTLRNSLNITQKQLGEHICTQAEISRIEKGNIMPYANTLFRIAERLGVDVNYFFEHANTPRLDYIQDTFSWIRSLVYDDKYGEMERIVMRGKIPYSPLPFASNFYYGTKG
jgi:transcriptional regulator with XRE-family HTH domain